MYQDIIDKLISITDTIPWFRACADTNMMYDEELDKIIIDFSFESIDSNGIKYFERYCKDNDIDTASVGPLINKQLKEKIQAEAEKLNLVEKSSTAVLPI